jgi:hypothetical protein
MSWGPQGPPDLPLHRNMYIEFVSPEGHTYLLDSGVSEIELGPITFLLESTGHRVAHVHTGLPTRKERPGVTFISRWWV